MCNRKKGNLTHLQFSDGGSDGVHFSHDRHEVAAVLEVNLVFVEKIQQFTPLLQDVLFLLSNGVLSTVILSVQFISHLCEIFESLLLQ